MHCEGGLWRRRSSTCRASLLVGLCAQLLGRAALAFDLFAEQQLLPREVLSKTNESEFGSTHVDNYWVNLDGETGVTSPGVSLSRHVRLGCFEVQWDAVGPPAFSTPPSPRGQLGQLSGHADLRIGCVASCNSTQAYYRQPACRCGVDGQEPPLGDQVIGLCPATSWEVFREYDYRSSLSPSTFDAARHLMYQIVTVRVPRTEPSIRHYVHAVDAVEATPRFEFDTRLDRMIFNAVWDFGRSRMIALSFRDWGSTLDLTVISFNTSIGALMVRQEHHPVQDQISHGGELLSAGLASADGMGTVDVLFGTYYTVVPARLPGSTQVVHTIVAIDIEGKKVLQSVTLPITLMNLQINALQHVLYGAGADQAGRYAYFELCRAAADSGAAAADGTGTGAREGGPEAVASAKIITVNCRLSELGSLPSVVNHMYLQSASIDHELNYAWFTYKQATAGSPQILEYHHDTADYALWPEDTFHPDVAYASLIQPSAGPQLVFSLRPPALLHARFSPKGNRLIVTFDAPTLRGAVPFDNGGDGVPDAWDELPVGEQLPCERFLDERAVQALPGAACHWASATELVAEVTPRARLAPGDVVKLRPGTIFAADRSPSGIAVFSAPAEGSVVAEPPEDVPVPRAVISLPGASRRGTIDGCSDLVLDGSASAGHGLRGAFVWSVTAAEPALPAAKLLSLEKALAFAATEASESGGGWAQVLTIPSAALVTNTAYHFSLSITSFFNPSVSDKTSSSVFVAKEAGGGLASLGSASVQAQAMALAAALVPTAGASRSLGILGAGSHVGSELGAAAVCNTSSEALPAQPMHFGPAPPPSPPWGNHQIVFGGGDAEALAAAGTSGELRHI